MIRGTTAQFKFKLPYKKNELEWVTIKFWQPRNSSPLLPITRVLSQCDGDADSTELCTSLTAEETKIFLDDRKAMVQFRARHTNGTVFGSRPNLITVYPMLDDIIEENPTFDNVSEGFVILDGDPVITE